jgi:hypothetical protein
MKKYLLPLLIIVFIISLTYACKKANGDTNKPFIVLYGPNPAYAPQGVEYIDAGAIAWDVTESGDTVDISNRLEVNNNVNVDITGEYEVKYNVSDEAGNWADEKIRIVKVLITK